MVEFPRLYTVAEIAALLRVHPRTIERYLEARTVFPGAIRIKRRWLIPSADLEQLLQEKTEPAEPSRESE